MTDFSAKEKSEWSEVHSDVVPLIGVEPIRYHYHRILSPARLPIPPQRHIKRLNKYIIYPTKNQDIFKKYFLFFDMFKILPLILRLGSHRQYYTGRI